MDETCKQRVSFKEKGNKNETYTYNHKATVEISGTQIKGI